MQPHRSLDSIEALLIRAAAYVICLGSPRIANALCEKEKKKKEKRVILPSWFRDRYVRVRGHESLLAGEKEWRFNKQVDGICLREITVLVAKEQRQVSLT